MNEIRNLKILIVCLTANFGHAIEHTPWNLDGAQERIEKFRKGDCVVKLILPDGSKLPGGTTIDLKQTDHAFQFGGSLAQARRLGSHESFKKYKDKFANLFNYATIGFYWGWYERNPDSWRLTGNTRELISWAQQKGMRLRGHPLMWHNAIPKFIEHSELSAEQLDPIISEHVRMLVKDFPEMYEWDLYNEAPGIRLEDESNGARRWVEWQGGPGPMTKRMVETVRGVRPDARYIVNHFRHNDPEFYEMIDYLNKNSVDFDKIGIQAHMHTLQELWSEDEMIGMLERYSKYDKPIQLTELTILSCEPLSNWREMQAWQRKIDNSLKQGEGWINKQNTEEGLKFQAEFARDFYTLAFSYPNVEAIIWWSVSDVDCWRGMPSGLVDMQGNPKPAYAVLDKLINKDWRTELNVPVDRNNEISFRGFYGSYLAQVNHRGRLYSGSFNLENNQTGVVTVTLKEQK